jgi:glyoxylate reductase
MTAPAPDIPARPKAVVTFPLAGELMDRVRERCEVVELAPPIGRAELSAALRDADGLLLTNLTRIDAGLLEQATHLKVVSNIGVGLDHVDVAAADRLGIEVHVTPVVSGAVAELAIALAITLSRRVRDAIHCAADGRWRQAPLGRDLQGKTIFLVGFGRIGREVARRALVFGMHVCFFDVSGDAGMEGAQRLPDLATGLRMADFVSLHVDLNEGTRHLIGAAELSYMKPSAYLINTARGGVVDQGELTRALSQGRIAGAGLDVLEEEPPRPDEPLLFEQRAIVVPHIGTATEETRREMRELAVQNLLAGIGESSGARHPVAGPHAPLRLAEAGSGAGEARPAGTP